MELGFGCDFADFDNDGWLDLVVANGHILDNIAEIQSNLSFAQPGQLFGNARGRLARSREREGDLARPRVGRGLATLDYDRDGDLDLAIASNRGPAELLANEGGSRLGNSIGLLLIGTRSNRDGVGARVIVETPDLAQVEERRAGSSYLARHEAPMWFGLGPAVRAESVVIRWPAGTEDRLEALPAGALHVVREGAGVTGSIPLQPGRAR